jgi:hypothetical protein
MSRKSLFLAVAIVVASPCGPARAEICSIDLAPGATLLLPYFEVDIGDGDDDGEPDGLGVNTIFTVTNASAEPAIAHVTLWTDWAFATVDFDVFLTGYDSVSFNLFQIIGLGNLPVTADEQNDPSDTISPNGGNPDWDGSFDSCAGVFPYPEPIITGAFRNRVQNAHSGYPVSSLNNLCAGEGLNGSGECTSGDCPSGTIARGYVTVDSTNDCSVMFPFDTGYFGDGGTGTAGNKNHLSGEFLFLEGASTTAGGPLVAIEADDAFSAGSTPTTYTFYGRFTQADGGVDNREPLGTTWTAQFKGTGDSATDFVVWRDPTSKEKPTSGWTCGLSGSGAGPDWAPLVETEVVCVDEDTNVAEVLCAGQPGDPGCFPLATQSVTVGSGLLSPSFTFGTCHLNLNIVDSFPDDIDFPSPSGTIAQSYVFSLHHQTSVVRAAAAGTAVTDACENLDPRIVEMVEELFSDGFESGDTSGWSAAFPP